MATINSKEMIETIIKNDGYYDDDPRVIKITQYTNYYDGICFGVVWENERRLGQEYLNRYQEETEYVRNPRIIWFVDENGISHDLRDAK